MNYLQGDREEKKLVKTTLRCHTINAHIFFLVMLQQGLCLGSQYIEYACNIPKILNLNVRKSSKIVLFNTKIKPMNYRQFGIIHSSLIDEQFSLFRIEWNVNVFSLFSSILINWDLCIFFLKMRIFLKANCVDACLCAWLGPLSDQVYFLIIT